MYAKCLLFAVLTLLAAPFNHYVLAIACWLRLRRVNYCVLLFYVGGAWLFVEIALIECAVA